MTSIRDLRPTFFVARFFGLAPYSITDTGLNLSKPRILYTVLWMPFYAYALYVRLATFFNEDVESKFRALSIIRSILVVCAIVLDVILCVARDRTLQNILSNMKKYDLAVKYDVAANARILRIHSWTAFGFLIIFFLLIGWSTYSYEASGSLSAGIIYVYFYLPLSISVMKFVTLIASIFLRFRHLNQMLLPDFVCLMMELDSDSKRLHLCDVCWLHSCLCSAAKDVNSLFSIQLLMWFANFTFNMISRISAFTDTSDRFSGIMKYIRDGGLVFIFVLLVCVIAGICHLTSVQANKVGASVFMPSSRYWYSRIRHEQDKEDKFSIGQYFALHPLHFTAAFGFFRINLPLLLKIAGAMTTYLVILNSPTKC